MIEAPPNITLLWEIGVQQVQRIFWLIWEFLRHD
jgi:hypothetical protein